MSTTKSNKKPVEVFKKNEPVQVYPKDALMRAARWKDRKDLLNALLADGASYSIEAVDQMINEYFNKEV